MAADRVSSTDGELLEREDESNLLSAQLAAAAEGTGCVVWIEGPAGVGKTSLLGVAARRAQDHQMLVLRGTGHEPERLYPFGVVRQLFEQVVRGLSAAEREEVFAGAAANARPLVDVQVEPSPHAREPAVFFHALYWLTAALTTTSPVVILVDDLQWVDEESAAFLAYLGRRIEDLPVALFTASRPLDPDPAAPSARELRGAATLEVVPRELSREATAELVARLLSATGGAESVDPGFADACHRVTGGNPFYLGELARALREDEVTPTAAGILHVQQVQSSELVKTVLRRVGNLGADANAVARALAVLGAGASVRHVAAVAELPESDVAVAADRLAASGILANGLPLRFAHPIVEVAVDREDNGARRAERHARAARVLLTDGAPAESVARHLLEIEPLAVAQAGEVLDEAARRALAVGGAAAALRYLERALREPAAAAVTARRHYQAGLAARLAGDAAASVSHLESAVELCPDPEERVAMTLELANAYHVVRRLGDALDLLTEAIDAAPNHDALLALTAGLAGVAISAADFHRVAEPLEALAATLTGATAVDRELLVHLATVRIVTGVALPRRVIGLVKKAVAAGVVADTTADRPPVTWAGTWLLAADELDLALTVAEEAVADAQSRGSLLGYGVATTLRAQVLLAHGDVAAAEADAVAAYDAVRSAGWRVGIEQTAGALATVLVERGRLDEVLALVREHEHDRSHAAFTLLIAQAQALLAQGRAAEAAGVLEPFRGAIIRFRNVAGLTGMVLALHGAGRTSDAERFGRRFIDDPDEAPRAAGGALRALALAAGPEGGIDLARRSVRLLEDGPARLDHAYAVVALGELLRRGGLTKEARDVLREGLDLAVRCGATALADRAREELTSAGARPRRDALTGAASLTGTERRVAELAMRGLSNPEIAQALFVSRKTVEKHLVSVFAKLGITARGELGERLRH